ncbi:MAG: alpha/beta fold hydrolase, partial [Alphaproteobacteria bacterium]|nr:alpha/beta fold hydrolase [Alphaproteobacteria bacterium]
MIDVVERVAHREAGTGEPMVLLHGIGSGAGSWANQLGALPARTIAWDAPGYGASAPLPGDSPDAGAYAGALATLLDSLAVDRCVLVGQSLGAIVAARYSVDRPQRVRRLVLLAPARGHAALPAADRRRKLAERIDAMTRLGVIEHARQRAPHQLGPRAPAAALALVRENMERLDLAGYAQAARLLAQSDIALDAPHCRMKVIVASGSEDRI